VSNGAQGAAGVAGKDGVSCQAAAVSGGVQITCPGSMPLVISNGQNATPVTVVQLCPGTPVYPSKFIEVGVCLGGSLYGVYSANGGFMTYLPPGRYTSDGINASCSITVGPNCTVSND
jgi:hypothetical protein